MLRQLTRRLAGVAAVAAIALPSTQTLAAMLVSTADGNGADTSLQNDGQSGGTSAIVFGGATGADFRRYDDVRQKMLLFRFDISDLDASAYADAQLAFDYYSNRTRPLRVYGIVDGPLDNWDEATTSYSNAPGILQPADGGAAYDSAANNFLNPTQLFNPGPPNASRPNPFQLGTLDVLDVDPTPGRAIAVSDTSSLDLEAFLNADTNGLVSFLIFHDFTNNGHTGSVQTKESGGYAPLLGIVPPELVPEPTTAVLAMLGMIGFVSRRR